MLAIAFVLSFLILSFNKYKLRSDYLPVRIFLFVRELDKFTSAFLTDGWFYTAWQFRSPSKWTFRVRKSMDTPESDFLAEFIGFFKILICLSRESRDDIGTESNGGNLFPNPIHFVKVIFQFIFSVPFNKNLFTSGLKRNMKMRAKFILMGSKKFDIGIINLTDFNGRDTDTIGKGRNI